MEKKINIIMFISLFLSNCYLPVSSNRLFESFYLGNGNSNFFIKPLEFQGDKKSKLLIDITLNMMNQKNRAATINFSIINKKVIKADSIVIITNDKSVSLREIQLLFIDKDKNKVLSRYTSKTDLMDIISLFKNYDWHIKTYSNGEKYVYNCSNKTKKKIKIINDNLFTIL